MMRSVTSLPCQLFDFEPIEDSAADLSLVQNQLVQSTVSKHINGTEFLEADGSLYRFYTHSAGETNPAGYSRSGFIASQFFTITTTHFTTQSESYKFSKIIKVSKIFIEIQS
uniref:(northern house mosquito) hypothetical protein n=1 Tax=Culex pipiens TaxID=7175 RepID=A0A8D8PDB5_CULPI